MSTGKEFASEKQDFVTCLVIGMYIIYCVIKRTHWMRHPYRLQRGKDTHTDVCEHGRGCQRHTHTVKNNKCFALLPFYGFMQIKQSWSN